MDHIQVQILICKKKNDVFLLKILFYNKPKPRPENKLGQASVCV
jgi:hypothetical protein